MSSSFRFDESGRRVPHDTDAAPRYAIRATSSCADAPRHTVRAPAFVPCCPASCPHGKPFPIGYGDATISLDPCKFGTACVNSADLVAARTGRPRVTGFRFTGPGYDGTADLALELLCEDGTVLRKTVGFIVNAMPYAVLQTCVAEGRERMCSGMGADGIVALGTAATE